MVAVDRVQARVRRIVRAETARAYGHPRHPEPLDVRCPCGHMYGDHCTDGRGCLFCECTARDET